MNTKALKALRILGLLGTLVGFFLAFGAATYDLFTGGSGIGDAQLGAFFISLTVLMTGLMLLMFSAGQAFKGRVKEIEALHKTIKAAKTRFPFSIFGHVGLLGAIIGIAIMAALVMKDYSPPMTFDIGQSQLLAIFGGTALAMVGIGLMAMAKTNVASSMEPMVLQLEALTKADSEAERPGHPVRVKRVVKVPRTREETEALEPVPSIEIVTEAEEVQDEEVPAEEIAPEPIPSVEEEEAVPEDIPPVEAEVDQDISETEAVEEEVEEEGTEEYEEEAKVGEIAAEGTDAEAFECPNCGGMVTIDDPICTNCGAKCDVWEEAEPEAADANGETYEGGTEVVGEEPVEPEVEAEAEPEAVEAPAVGAKGELPGEEEDIEGPPGPTEIFLPPPPGPIEPVPEEEEVEGVEVEVATEAETEVEEVEGEEAEGDAREVAVPEVEEAPAEEAASSEIPVDAEGSIVEEVLQERSASILDSIMSEISALDGEEEEEEMEAQVDEASETPTSCPNCGRSQKTRWLSCPYCGLDFRSSE